MARAVPLHYCGFDELAGCLTSLNCRVLHAAHALLCLCLWTKTRGADGNREHFPRSYPRTDEREFLREVDAICFRV